MTNLSICALAIGRFAFHHVRPEFVDKVKQGSTIVVAGVVIVDGKPVIYSNPVFLSFFFFFFYYYINDQMPMIVFFLFFLIYTGKGFGCGSSREEAVSTMVWCGVHAVIAKSFSFIFGRNLLTLNLFGITLQDEEFYELVGLSSFFFLLL